MRRAKSFDLVDALNGSQVMSFLDQFFTMICKSCQHNLYLKMSIINKNLGNAKKHNGQILDHNKLRPSRKGGAMELQISRMFNRILIFTLYSID